MVIMDYRLKIEIDKYLSARKKNVTIKYPEHSVRSSNEFKEYYRFTYKGIDKKASLN